MAKNTSFATRHPYLIGLFKRIVTIIVTWNVLVACFIGTMLFFGIVLVGATVGSQAGNSDTVRTIYGNGSNGLLSIKISGMIMGSNDSGDVFSSLLGDSITYGYDIKEQLRKAAEDSTVSGVILEIDSPGGTIYGSRAIADGIAHYKNTAKKPVYAHIQGSGASGAYWAAASADVIYADYGSIIGSIGVVMGPFQYYNTPLAEDGGLLGGGVVTQNGIESVTITAGTSKDLGNPYRRLTESEVQLLQQSINNEYDEFVRYISTQRDIPENEVRDNIGALIYDPKLALKRKLINAIGSRDDAYQALAKAAEIADDFQVIREESPANSLQTLLGAFTPAKQPQTTTPSLCNLSRSVLAYHGDVTRFCKE